MPQCTSLVALVEAPAECDSDPEGLEHCLEGEGYWFSLCEYGGGYENRVMDCSYISDQCHEGDGFLHPFYQ